jgi:diguanylate cyclase (GGDEF)-like protein/hemerythrin-like metal-binding protein
MPPLALLADPTQPATSPLASQVALAGLLVALTLVGCLAYRPLRDRWLNRLGLGGLATGALLASTLALLTCCAILWAASTRQVEFITSLIALQFALIVLTVALGRAILNRMTLQRSTTEAVHADQLVAASREARDLAEVVESRNAELSARLSDLGDARRAAELANDGLQRALEQLEEAASTDRLTGAWNRRRFEEAALSELALAQRRRDPLSLLMFDLDHFKQVNDTYGHGAGDAVLVGLVQTVRQHLRVSDSLIRWGGEEFLVMVPATRLEGAMALAEKMRAAVAAIDFPGIGQVTMSLGVAQYAPGESLAAWIERADQALYGAKSAGRNRSQAAPMPAPTAEVYPGRTLLEVVWDDAYESGNALIDKQHQRLFQLANSLMAVVTEETPMSEVALRLETLLAHTSQHFHDEEALLREAHYPDLAKHATVHANLLARARQLQADVQADRLDFGKLVTFLALDLVKGHFLSEDQNYFERLHQLGASGDA